MLIGLLLSGCRNKDGEAYGGDGGDGRIKLAYDSLSGSTTPTASTDSYTD